MNYYGITPAHAGKTKSVRCGAKRKKDHPRPCGENELQIPEFFAPVGSPPPMRGKLLSGPQSDSALRITPAHAGKTPQQGTETMEE